MIPILHQFSFNQINYFFFFFFFCISKLVIRTFFHIYIFFFIKKMYKLFSNLKNKIFSSKNKKSPQIIEKTVEDEDEEEE